MVIFYLCMFRQSIVFVAYLFNSGGDNEFFLALDMVGFGVFDIILMSAVYDWGFSNINF